MSEGPVNEGRVSEGEPREAPSGTDWERRRRLAAVFGDVLPDTTTDERDPSSASDGPGEDAGEAWLKAQVPPHHG